MSARNTNVPKRRRRKRDVDLGLLISILKKEFCEIANEFLVENQCNVQILGMLI